jgi:hypothetical protein
MYLSMAKNTSGCTHYSRYPTIDFIVLTIRVPFLERKEEKIDFN